MSNYPKGGFIDRGQEIQVARGANDAVIKLPELRMARYSVAPDAKGTDSILVSVAISGGTDVFEPDGQPDIARQLFVTGNTNSAGAVVTIDGFDILGNDISEEITIPATPFTKATDQAFAEVKTITVTGGTENGTVKIGLGQGIGLPVVANAPTTLAVYFDGAIVAPGTWTHTVDVVDGIAAKNIINPGDTVGDNYNGTKILDVYFCVAGVREE